MTYHSKLAALLASLSSFSCFTVVAQSTDPSEPTEPSGTSGKITREIWWNMSNEVDLESGWAKDSFYQAADLQSESMILEAPQNAGDNYSQRLRGYIIAPHTGEYRFWLSGDDHSALWLSDGDSKFSKQKLVHFKGVSGYRHWGTSRDQASASIMLIAGQRYYVESQNKAAGGLDHLSVGWSYAGGAGLTNWARENGAVASQSTTGWGGAAERGIDGNTSGRYGDASITSTTDQSGSWWQVDLGQDRLIDRVELFNRDLDGSTVKRLSNFRVSILNASGALVISQDFHTTGSNVIANELWETGGVQGSVVKVELLGPGVSGQQILSLAEVEVLGRADSTAVYQPREVVPSSVLESYAGSLSDQDDDGYPDDWEVQYGLDPSIYQGGDFAPFADSDQDYITNLQEIAFGFDPFTADSVPGYLTMEHWSDINKYNVEDLIQSDAFFGEPDKEGLVDTAQFSDIKRYAGARLRGYITATVSGNYRFWLSSRNGGQLWLSENETKYHKKKLAEMGATVGTGHGTSQWDTNKWDQFASQMSKEVYLEAGQKYFMEVLTQQGHGGSRHVSVAWAAPDQAREELPMNVVSSYVFELEDSDDDYLPDAWEIQYGLSTTDNGGIDRLREGEYGDFDMDGLNNLEEYIAGTFPHIPDSDSDGISDGDEVKTYRSDPTLSDAPAETLTADLDLETHSSNGLTWTLTSEGLIASSFRGAISWGFNTPSSGVWSIHINTRLLGDLYLNETIPVKVSIDGNKVWTGKIVYGQSREGSIRILTPQLPAGAHTVELMIDNMIARRSVAIKSVKVYQPDGMDTDGNGQPDWVQSQLTGANTIAPYLSASRTSPAFVEGQARILSDIILNGSSINEGLDTNHWYANIPLDLAQPTLFNVAFEPGISDSGSISWADTNVLNSETLTVRRGDSLKLVARPNGVATNQPVSFTLPGSTNWAAHPSAVATQSTTGYGGVASRAIDGNTNGAYGAGSVTHTNNQAGTYWQVDLGDTRSIDKVKLWNRIGDKNRLSNYRVSIIDSNGNIVVSKDYFTASGHTITSETWALAAPVDGQIVKVEFLGPNRQGNYILSLAECEVFGALATEMNSDSEALAHLFDKAGTTVITATHDSGSTGTLTVHVKQADFGSNTLDLVSNSLGDIKFANNKVDQDLFFDGGDSSDVTSSIISGEDLYLKILSRGNDSIRIAARLTESGPILGTQKINLIGISDALQNDLTQSFLSSDFQGYYQLNSPLVATNLPTGGKVKITIFRAGVTFPDGTKTKWLNSSDFANDTYNLAFLFPVGLSGGYCHYIDIYDRNGAFIERR